MSKTMYESDFPKSWKLIASIDESEQYEVDQTAIYKNGKEFVLATATGCSCWDGDWEVSKFRSLDRLFKSIGATGDGTGHQYNPTFAGAEALKTQVLAYSG